MLNRYPYHRYLRYLVLDGDDVDVIRRHIADLGFIAPKAEDVEFLRKTLYVGRVIDDEYLEKCDVLLFHEQSKDMEVMHWIVENEPARKIMQQALLDGTSARHCAQIVSYKFNVKCSERSASLFRRCFWDTEELSLVDFQRYFSMAGAQKPPPPQGVPLKMRGSFRAWENGIIPDEEELSTDDIMRAIQVDAFMAFEKAKAIPSPTHQEEARKWGTLALRASQIRKPKNAGKKDELPLLKPKVFYPQYDTPELKDVNTDAGDDHDEGGDDDDPI